MKPYYEDGGVTIYHGDCRDVLPQLDLAAGLAIIDPPYGDTSLDWDRLALDWLGPVTGSLDARAPLWLWGSTRSLMRHGPALAAAGWQFSQDIVWEKHNGSGLAADRFRRVHEQVTFWYRGKWSDLHIEPQYTNDATKRQVRRKQRPAHWGHIDAGSYRSEDGGPRLVRSVIYERSAHGQAVHPTQKPTGITHHLVRYAAPLGATILDPFAGSGTTLLVASQAGRRAVGVEVDERYCEAAARRLSQGALDFGGTA